MCDLPIYLVCAGSVGQTYYVEAKGSDGKDDYVYYLNVCGEVTVDGCKDPAGHVSACQVKKTGGANKIAGRYTNQTLRCVSLPAV